MIRGPLPACHSRALGRCLAGGLALCLIVCVAPALAQAPEPQTGEGTTPGLVEPAEATPPIEAPGPRPEAFRDTTLAAPPPAGDDADPNADLAYGAYQRGFFLTALHRATQRLDRDPNDAAAMTLIAEIHAEGLGVPQDHARAADWYRLAAQQGDANAAFALAMMTLEGRGRTRDLVEGRRLLEDAASGGHPRAAYNLAVLLIKEGGGAARARAAELLETAALAEIPVAQHALGALLADGIDGTPEPMRATAWLSRAARNGDVDAMVDYAIALFNGVGVAPDEEAAAGWFRRAAFRGNAIAQNRLARLLVAGRGVEPDFVEAATWHILAASRGLGDDWLDERLGRLSAEEAERAEAAARERAAFM